MAQLDQQLSLCNQKYRLRVELVPTEYESNQNVGPNDRVKQRNTILFNLILVLSSLLLPCHKRQ